MTETDEEVLEGGNVAGRVVRVGRTVRKPWRRSSPSVTALLEYLRRCGYEASPPPFGRDGRGRQVLGYAPGTMADRMAPMAEEELHRLGGVIRRLHDLTAAYRPPEEPVWEVPIPHGREELVCHNDLAPWNLVRDGDAWTFIDWDCAGPGTRMGDLGYAAHGFVPLHEGGGPVHDAWRLRALADGYGCDDAQRRELPGAVLQRVRGMYDLLVEGARTGRRPWARLYAEGHADHWGPAARYVERNRGVWLAALLS
ncbi:Ser/Thr protein kinase RdoA (MazF antagonist) [Nocardiopsis arvandica]|uniref:Ser/Thr protein kinase RdoA (MazF antagonist) n=1 Tax=Nocardiopsis sinuspersici TaxID=501010 RepID=A0A7Z0BN13_9ACTN|nr:phosphotransferase [Nocardiopsis sinuspersici]NYH55024.1 Ser/Thr protein kinase RdoA (MazF antagonist) [Nocardiopsis sinuspersici]